MSFRERLEYIDLLRRAEWTGDSIKRLRELREWKDREDVPEELRTPLDYDFENY